MWKWKYQSIQNQSISLYQLIEKIGSWVVRKFSLIVIYAKIDFVHTFLPHQRVAKYGV
jgi:hypothetical protein